MGARGEGPEFVTTSGTGLPNLNPLPEKRELIKKRQLHDIILDSNF